MAPPAHLIVLPPGAAPRVALLSGEPASIGSGEGCTVRLGDPDVEPLHARVEPDGAGWKIERRGESLWVNGKRVRQQVLEANDLIVIGRTAISFRYGTPAADAAPRDDVVARLQALSRRLDANDAPGAVRLQVLEDLEALTGADSGAFAWLDERGAVETVEAGGTETSRKLSRTVIARVIDERRALLTLSAGDEGLEAQSLRDAKVIAVMAAPVLHGDRLAGVLYLSSARPASFSHAMLDWLVLYAGLVGHLLASRAWRAEAETREQAQREALEAVSSRTLVGSSPALQALLRDVARVAKSELAVLVVGETGTGKELVARALHEQSARAAGPFVAVNCGALPEQLVESTLFGHVKGAFTSAHADAQGLVRAASGGTLFLDEVGELPREQQAKLLRVLETREVMPVGATAAEAVDFRLVSATHVSLEAARKEGRFRDDLYFRLAGVVFKVPPLRERGDDTLQLAEHFLRKQRAALSRPGLRLSAAARVAIGAAAWPGNVRELSQAITRACALSDGDTLEPAALGLEGKAAAVIRPLAQVRDELVKGYVLEIVERFGGNRTAAAEALGVTPRTIFKYLEEI